jgi:hypothetical protein
LPRHFAGEPATPDAAFFRDVVHDEDENEEIESVDRPAKTALRRLGVRACSK